MAYTVRPIDAEEIDLFVSIPDGVPNVSLRDHIEAQWNSGESKPEWCFVLEDETSYLGRAAFWGFDTKDLNLGAWYVDWDTDKIQDGVTLIEGCCEGLQQMGIRSAEARLFSDRTTQLEERNAILIAAGFTLVQDKKRFSLELPVESVSTGEITLEQPSGPIVEIFQPLVEQAMLHSLDRADRLDLGLDDSPIAAKSRIDLLLNIDPDFSGWLIARNADAEVVGFVITQRFNSTIGVINYIGVLPNFIGKHYSLDLLRGAVSHLTKTGYSGVIAETDVENLPMLRALSDCGFQERSATRVLIKWLN